MRIVHLADLHLDAPFAWADERTARIRRANRRRTLERIVELARSERADAITSGGDLFEHDVIDRDTVSWLARTFGDAPCRVFLAPGNHDPYLPGSPYALDLGDLPNVTVFRDETPSPVALAPGVTLWGTAHRGPATPRDPLDGFHVRGDGIHLLLAHASERSGLPFQEQGKVPHAPIDAAGIEAAGFDFALLGHYHTPRDGERYLYPGNPDPLDFGEQGERGAALVTVDADGVRWERRAVAVSEVRDIDVDVTGSTDRDDVAERLGAALDGLRGSVRARLVGEVAPELSLDPAALAARGARLDGLVVMAEGMTYAYDLDAIAREETVRGQFVRLARDRIADADHRRRVVVAGLRAFDGRDDLEVA